MTAITPDRVDLDQTLPDGRHHTLHMHFDDVLTLIGYEQDKTLFKQLGIRMEDPGGKPIYDDETMETELPGVYVAGTAVGGTQSSKYQVFLENCHVHAAKITKHLLEYGIGSRNTQATSQAKPSASPELNRQIEMNPES